MTLVLAGLVGLVFGSFFNVCIWRIPRGESIVAPPSHCPRCKRPIAGYDNVPVLSYVILRGRCRHCRKPISLRYPLVEALVGVLFVVVVLRFGFSLAALKAAAFVSLLVVTALIDLDHQIIPFQLSLPGLGLGLAGALLTPPGLTDALVAAGAGAAFVGGAWLLWRYVLAGLFRRLGVDQKEGIGGGDLPYAAMIGAFIGWRALIVALFVAVAWGVLVGLATRVAGRSRAGQPMPFGPFLAVGGLAGLFCGDAMFRWYVSTMLH